MKQRKTHIRVPSVEGRLGMPDDLAEQYAEPRPQGDEVETVARALYSQGMGYDIDADPVARDSMFAVARHVLAALDARSGVDTVKLAENHEARIEAVEAAGRAMHVFGCETCSAGVPQNCPYGGITDWDLHKARAVVAAFSGADRPEGSQT